MTTIPVSDTRRRDGGDHMTTKKPGLYRGTVHGAEHVGLVNDDGEFVYLDKYGLLHYDPDALDLAPVQVADPTGSLNAAFAASLRSIDWRHLADQIEAQIPMPPMPPKIPEPKRFGAVVKSASTGAVWVNADTAGGSWQQRAGFACYWDDLPDDVMTVFAGVTE